MSVCNSDAYVRKLGRSHCPTYLLTKHESTPFRCQVGIDSTCFPNITLVSKDFSI